MLGYNGTGPRNIDLYYRVTPAGSEQIADTFMDVVNAYGLNLVPISTMWRPTPSATIAITDVLGTGLSQPIVAIEDYQNRRFHTPLP